MTEREVSSERVSGERVYLIRKGGAWYRPDSAGYTTNAHEAGRYTLEEAEKITHPNGPNGTRDAMSYQHQDSVPALRFSVKTVDEELLIDNAATASQNRTLIDDPVTWEAIKMNIINPLLSSVKTVAPSEYRQTFTIPDGHEAVLDAYGRATGETRPMAPSEVTELIAWLRSRAKPDSGLSYGDNSRGVAEATVTGYDAAFVAENFHGAGAARLASALTASLKGDRP